MSNLGLLHKIEDEGINVIETSVGDKYVVRLLMGNNLSVGGENSGHISVPEILHTGDGVLNALFVVNLLFETNTTITDWFNDIKMYADKMVSIKVENKANVLHNKALFDRIDGIKKELNNNCKIIVRASGTENLIRVSVMAKDETTMLKHSDELVNMIKAI